MSMITHPLPGETRFTSRLSDDEARRVAHRHYYGVEHVNRCSDQSGDYHAIMVRGAWKALIGISKGVSVILHKNPDGTRSLELV